MSTGVGAGDVIRNRFLLEEPAGDGGLGIVFRARDLTTRALLAVKIVKSEELAERLVREGEILAEVSRPAIVRYLAHGRTAQGLPFVAMEWLDGETLATWLSRNHAASAEECLRLAARLAGALGALHERGIVHRDVKPQNVFLPAGRIQEAKLLDLGIARPILDELDGAPLVVLAFARPELLAQFFDLWRGRRTTTIPLTGLSQTGSAVPSTAHTGTRSRKLLR